MTYATQRSHSIAAPTMDARHFEALFNNALIGIVLTTQAGEILFINPFAETLFGYVRDELVGQQVEVLIPNKFRGDPKERRQDFYRHPQTRMMSEGRELFAPRKDRTEFPAELRLSDYEFEGNNYVAAFIVDITPRKKAEELMLRQNEEQTQMMNARTLMLREAFLALEKSDEELRIAYEKEKELGEIKSRFVSMASHEFRSPLSMILSSLSLVRRYSGSEEIHNRERHISKIQNAVKNLNFILEDFLSLGKLEEGLVFASPELLDKQLLLADIDDLLKEMNQAAGKNQQMILSGSLTGDLFSVDKKLLRNILTNLVSNAIKYSSEKSVITVHCCDEAGNLQVSVRDNGIGISEGEQGHLFERFFRANNTSGIQGTGLGLHIVRRYLDLMGGSISYYSKLNEGTIITICIPQQGGSYKQETGL